MVARKRVPSRMPSAPSAKAATSPRPSANPLCRKHRNRRDRIKALEGLNAARKSGDVEEGPLSMGQDAGLIYDIPPAGDIVTRIAQQAEEILIEKMPRLIVR